MGNISGQISADFIGNLGKLFVIKLEWICRRSYPNQFWFMFFCQSSYFRIVKQIIVFVDIIFL